MTSHHGGAKAKRGLRDLGLCVGAMVGVTLGSPASALSELGTGDASSALSHASHLHHHADCAICCGDVSAGSPDGVDFADFQIGARWTSTALTPLGVGARGTPVTLTWGFAQEGSTIVSTRASEATGPSSLVAFLDGIRDPASTGGADLTQRNWFGLFEQSFGRLDELSGVTYVYEPNDDGANISGSLSNATLGSPGVRADIRIGGHSIDGQASPNTLAYNYFPAGGDMVLDTDNVNLYSSTFLNDLQFRQVIMHEAGHGLGLSHVESNNSNQLMEPFINIAFDGPQFDDILGLHRNYGDSREENGGNDFFITADDLGTFDNGDAFALGTDAGNTSVVTPGMTDFVSIDDDSDEDWYRFTITEPTVAVDAILTPKGPTYNEGPQNAPNASNPVPQTVLNTAALSDLRLRLLDQQLNVIVDADQTVAGGAESAAGVVLGPGDYYVAVSGADNQVQMYRLDLIFTPEPALATALLGVLTLIGRRRRL
ncbi:MAG: matrixin family metalloprotease [Planctomycetota bacterium]